LLYVLYYKILFQWIKRKRRNETIARCLDNIVAECEGDRICFYFGDEKWTYKQIQALSFRVQIIFKKLVSKRGFSWTGHDKSARNGCHLDRIRKDRGNFSAHQHEPSGRFTRKVSFSSEMQGFHYRNRTERGGMFTQSWKEPTSVAKDQEPNYLDPILYLFTSGTTGIPKAVACSHGRLCFLASTASAINFSPMTLLTLLFQCIMLEACFHLCGPLFTDHLVFSTGSWSLSESVFSEGWATTRGWAAFQERFKVKTFVDIYGSTEGNCTMINLEEKLGHVATFPIWLQPSHPIQLIKIDQITGEIVRDEKTGFAIRCEDGEPGELIGKLLILCQCRDLMGTSMATTIFKIGLVTRSVGKQRMLHNHGQFDIQSLTEGMKLSLPKYAMPMFIRLISNSKGLDMTGTLKFQKFRLRDDGFNIESIEDPILIYSSSTDSYSKMDLE
ncbi:Long-chain fatty acid transport protein 1, partial [Orchesella cincta]